MPRGKQETDSDVSDADRFAAASDPRDSPQNATLSARESQILSLTASGLVDKQICAHLGISRNTLATYWKRIRAKFGFRSRSALVSEFVRGELSEASAPTTFASEGVHGSAFYYAAAISQCEEAKRRAARALKVISAFTKEITGVSSEDELLQAACRILVEVGGYSMAWIGTPIEQNGKQVVRPIAQYGDRSSYLHSVTVSWGKDKIGRGPGGRAVRTSRTTICRDILADPAMVWWREAATKAGFQSSIGVPLNQDGKVTAILGAYAPEPDAFDEEETIIIEGLVAILSFALTCLRKQPA